MSRKTFYQISSRGGDIPRARLPFNMDGKYCRACTTADRAFYFRQSDPPGYGGGDIRRRKRRRSAPKYALGAVEYNFTFAHHKKDGKFFLDQPGYSRFRQVFFPCTICTLRRGAAVRGGRKNFCSRFFGRELFFLSFPLCFPA